MRTSSSEGMTGSGSPTGERLEAVRVWLLGGFRVSVGPRTIEDKQWRLRRASALVKLLALAAGHHIHREQAMDILWPDSSRTAASNSLRSALHAARKVFDPAMGARYVASEREALVLCPEGDLWVDVEAFEEAASTAHGSQDPAAYRATLDLYGGELLPGDRYEEWAESRRQELRHTWLAVHADLARVYEESGEYEKGIAVLQRAVLEEPTNEEVHASLMRLYAYSERREDALAQYERLREALSRELDAEVGATAEQLREEIAAGKLSPAQPTVSPTEETSDVGKHNLPTPRTSFVGREQEIVEIRRTLTITRLLTLTGAGGSGKTRLALEVARDMVGVYPDGVWLVELAGLSEGDLIPQAVGAALRVPERPGQALVDTLVEALADKEVLLVLDNCEHLVDAAAQLVYTLLDACPRLRVLATSREALGVEGEALWGVGPLSVPDRQERPTAEELEGYESTQLFVERALFVEWALYGSSGLALGPDNAWAVAQICRRLEGIPLAIELAAAWVGTLTVEQISERLEVSLGLLRGGRTLTRRQRTLRGAVDWSYDLLGNPERRLFRRLSVFAGGWTLEAAEALGPGEGLEEEVLELLWGLVNKSLVVAGAGTQGAAARYRMLEPVRQYAREKLEESGEAPEVQDRHAAFFLALAERADSELTGPKQSVWVERLEVEHDNMREVLSWALQRGEAELALELGTVLWRFWYTRGYLSEGVRWLDQALAGGKQAAPARLKAFEGMGWLSQRQGDLQRAEATYEEMLKLSRELDDKGHVATALNSLGTLAVAEGDNERAKSLLEENLAVLRELEEGNPATKLKRYHALNLLGILAINEEDDYARGAALWEEGLALVREAGEMNAVGSTLSNLGYAALLLGDYERATALSEEALALARELRGGNAEIIPETLVNLGLAAREQGYHERASASLKEALAVSQHAGTKPSVINTLEGMAGLSGALGEDARAAHLWGAAEEAREISGIALPPPERTLHEPYLDSARSRLGEAAWEEALTEGRAMSLEEAAEYALAREPDHTTPSFTASEESSSSERPVVLTPRENEVALLVSRGLTNRQIASQLMLSEHTVATHVRNALKKLGLYSRRQIAAWVTEPHKPLP